MLLTEQPSHPIRPSLAHLSIPRHAEDLTRQDDIEYDMDAFVETVEAEFRAPLHTPMLKQTSLRLQEQFREKLEQSDMCMLPSYNDALPTGNEVGEYLVVDVGGSTIRIARVRLHGRSKGKHGASEILHQCSFYINDEIRLLPGTRFFDWMARKVSEFLVAEAGRHGMDSEPYRVVGVSWSFPLDHTSTHSARLLQMGKGFCATEGLIGSELNQLIQDACHREGIDIRVGCIVNDGTASLLSQMYVDDSTTIAVILGTGLNAAIHLPATAFSTRKLAASTPFPPNGTSPDVLVNTELSMFGKNALSTTTWDETLNSAHPRPDFQPMEHLTSGRYIGEIVRLILFKACTHGNLFGREVPQNFNAYQLECSTIAGIEAGGSGTRSRAWLKFERAHPLQSGRPYTEADVEITRRIITCVSDRAAAYMATAIHALWSLKRSTAAGAPATTNGSTTISCLGSIIGKYPHFRERVQLWLDQFTMGETCQMHLDMTDEGEGALIGAAVAVALDQRHETG